MVTKFLSHPGHILLPRRKGLVCTWPFSEKYFLLVVCLLSHLTLELSITQTKKKITDSKSSNGLTQIWEMWPLQLTSINILFHALVKTLDFRYTTPSRKHFKQVQLLRSHYECWAEVLEEICNVACCTATTDMWTSRTTHLCMSLMVHCRVSETGQSMFAHKLVF